MVPSAFEALRQSQPLPASLSLTFHSHDHPLSTSVIPQSGLLLGLGAHATASVTAGSVISHNPGPSHTRAWSPQTCPKTTVTGGLRPTTLQGFLNGFPPLGGLLSPARKQGTSSLTWMSDFESRRHPRSPEPTPFPVDGAHA